MSDLISRSELLHYMKNTELSQYIDEVNRGNDNYNSTPLYDYVKEMPTAYSVENVVMELEKLADESYKAYCIAFNSDDRAEYDAYTNAIEIVKQGGVSDDVCKWNCDVYGRWHTECHILADNDPLEYTYCPYCGKEIKVVESGGE